MTILRTLSSALGWTLITGLPAIEIYSRGEYAVFTAAVFGIFIGWVVILYPLFRGEHEDHKRTRA